jgi:hypothetical protein
VLPATRQVATTPLSSCRHCQLVPLAPLGASVGSLWSGPSLSVSVCVYENVVPVHPVEAVLLFAVRYKIPHRRTHKHRGSRGSRGGQASGHSHPCHTVRWSLLHHPHQCCFILLCVIVVVTSPPPPCATVSSPPVLLMLLLLYPHPCAEGYCPGLVRPSATEAPAPNTRSILPSPCPTPPSLYLPSHECECLFYKSVGVRQHECEY